MEDRLILPVPDEAALEQALLAEKLPVIGEVAGRVAHGVAVFALDERALFVQRLLLLGAAVCLTAFDGRIHRREKVRVGLVPGLFVMDRA